MAAIVSREPCLYIPAKEMIVQMRDGTARATPLRQLIPPSGTQAPITRRVLARLLAKATELSIPLRLGNIRKETDPEVPGWEYAVVPLRIEAPEEVFPAIERLLVQEATRGLRPKEASQVVLEVERV